MASGSIMPELASLVELRRRKRKHWLDDDEIDDGHGSALCPATGPEDSAKKLRSSGTNHCSNAHPSGHLSYYA